jgi:hypothetical protein
MFLDDQISWTFITLIMAAPFWLFGLWGQRLFNAHSSTDYSCRASSPFAYLFGVRPGAEKVFLRMASVQTVGLLYLIINIALIVHSDEALVKSFWLYYWAISLPMLALFWGILNLLQRKR